MLDFRISSWQGFTEKIGELVSMLEYTRELTLSEVSDLTELELDYLADHGSNTIGSLLLHITSIEFVHQIISFENRDINEVERMKWGSALELGEKARAEIKNHSIEHYLEELSKTREKTLTLLKSKQDDWLFEENKWDNGIAYNNYWLWYHVMEDEISHRGQIRIMRRMLANHN